MPAHSKKISVDLRGFHIFDEDDSSSDDDEGKTVSNSKTLKSKIKHAKKMSVDLQGYHLFNDGESSEDEEVGPAPIASAPPKKMHDKKISVDLRGFDLFYESDEDQDDDDEEKDDEVGAVTTAGGEKKNTTSAVSPEAAKAYKKVENKISNDEDDDLKGFHLFDEYNSEDEDDDEVIKLHELEKDQLTVLVRNLLVENAILKDAASRARSKLDSRKLQLKEAQQSKISIISALAKEMNRMRDDIRSLAASSSNSRAATVG